MSSDPRVVHTHTFGCKVNLFDTLSMEAQLEKVGNVHVDASRNKEPDTVIINTCTVTESADRQAKQLIRKVSRKFPDAKIVVTGCYAEHEPEKIREMPAQPKVVPIKEQFTLPQVLGWDEHVSEDFVPVKSRRVRATLKLQNGCNAYCSFCILPYIRGRSSSIPLENVLKQAKVFQSKGHQEIVLTGTHIGCYGRDLKPRLRFSDALKKLIEEVPQVKFRISSLEPTTLTPDVIRVVQEHDQIQPHFHIPMQSGSDAVLKRMNRKYKSIHFGSRIESLWKARPDSMIGTDVIVGYSGETSGDFEQTYSLLEELPIHYFHVFPFSARPGTKANTLEDDVPAEEKKDRVHRLRELSQKKQVQFFSRFLSQTEQVSVEKKKDGDLLCGVTPHYIPVRFFGPDRLMEKSVDVRLNKVKVNPAGDQYVVGEVVHV